MLHSFTSLRYVQGNSRLQKIKARVDAAKLAGKDEIGVRVGKIINQYKVAKHFELVIEDAAFVFRRPPVSLRKPRWMAFTSFAPRCRLRTWRRQIACATTSHWPTSSAPSARSKPSTSRCARFITVWPIGYAHTSSCACSRTMSSGTCAKPGVSSCLPMPARRSQAALTKVARDTLDDDTPVHSFGTLMAELATIVRNTCRTPQAAKSVPTFEVLTSPNAKQQRAIELLRQIKV